jgi:hypothetical protein
MASDPVLVVTMVRVRFVNGVERVLLFQEKDVVLLWLGEAQAIRPAVPRRSGTVLEYSPAG